MMRGMPIITFTPLAEDGFPLLARWLAAPHVRAWWGDPAEELAGIADDLASGALEQFIVRLDGRPIGYLQCYRPDDLPDHPYNDGPAGTRGVDVTIGEADAIGRGYGSAALRQFVDALFEAGVPRAVIDPDPKNIAAIRAYEKAGFHPIDERDTEWGRVLLMARENDRLR